ncbi:MAG: N-acetyltransferase [Candidatus Puniceispirillum sp.]|nr:N-acetyltransferase [Candidatus Puniceispirillum sp.]MBL6773795.1 N-acetyltransferase [Candidatus Puniceispirillum sp.]
MDGSALNLHISAAMAAIDVDEWDALTDGGNPFVSHAFLLALEDGGAVGGDSGWDPMHLLLRNDDGQLLGAVPTYLKHHSYGEYIFDHGWANAFERAGGAYYPKLLVAIPFTPATGPRLLVKDNRDDLKIALARGLESLLEKYQLSSAHVNFLPSGDADILSAAGWLQRSSIQFHWHNRGYADFDDFLASLSSRKRKNIRKERAAIAAAGVTMRPLTGSAINQDHIDYFYRFYLSTIDRKWGGAYLTHAVFSQLRRTMADRMLLVMAEYNGQIIGGALNFIGHDALYGRNWGADIDIPNLHFEACYYQAIEFAIATGLSRVEAGAQGIHKVQRGYLPVTTHSVHHIAHDGFREAVSRFLASETRGVEAEKNHIAMTSPFKAS